MLKEACIVDFLIFVKNATNIDKQIWEPVGGQCLAPCSSVPVIWELQGTNKPAERQISDKFCLSPPGLPLSRKYSKYLSRETNLSGKNLFSERLQSNFNYSFFDFPLSIYTMQHLCKRNGDCKNSKAPSVVFWGQKGHIGRIKM